VVRLPFRDEAQSLDVKPFHCLKRPSKQGDVPQPQVCRSLSHSP
jgi:hypothetical protein